MNILYYRAVSCAKVAWFALTPTLEGSCSNAMQLPGVDAVKIFLCVPGKKGGK